MGKYFDRCITQEDVRHTAFRIAEASKRPHSFQNGMAGCAWLDGFRSRHPHIAVHIAQSLSYSRAVRANEEIICDYFAKLGAMYARLNIPTNPMIFNVDETGISIVHKPRKVITEVGRKNVWSLSSAEKGKKHHFDMCVCIWQCAPTLHDLSEEEDGREP